MAAPAIAQRATQAIATYGPGVYEKAKDMLSKATNGKVTNVTDIVSYVGKSEQRMTVVADSLIRSGMRVDDVLPSDLMNSNARLQAMRASANALAASLQRQFDAGADKVIPAQSATDSAADIIRLRRVKAVLSVYGSEDVYFLCHPNGGVPSSDFAFAKAVRKAI